MASSGVSTEGGEAELPFLDRDAHAFTESVVDTNPFSRRLRVTLAINKIDSPFLGGSRNVA